MIGIKIDKKIMGLLLIVCLFGMGVGLANWTQFRTYGGKSYKWFTPLESLNMETLNITNVTAICFPDGSCMDSPTNVTLYINDTYADETYLRLDTTNAPLTGNLSMIDGTFVGTSSEDGFSFKDGNVGIGTDSPWRKVTMEDNSSAVSVLFINHGNHGLIVDWNSSQEQNVLFRMQGSNKWAMGVNGDNGRFQIASGNNYLSDIPEKNIVITLKESTPRSVGINSVNPSYPLEVMKNVSEISIYSESNISATGYNVRTTNYDKSKGSALNYIQDSDYYTDSKGEIDHSKFYGYAGEIQVADYSRPVVEDYLTSVCDEAGNNCKEEFIERNTFPYNKTESQVSLNMEVDVLRQAVYELKIQNQELLSRVAILEEKLNNINKQIMG